MKVLSGKSPDAIISQLTTFEWIVKKHLKFEVNAREEFPIVGDKETKNFLINTITYLNSYKKSAKKIGITIPKGILICGPPGVGKTFLVCQIARLTNTKMVLSS